MGDDGSVMVVPMMDTLASKANSARDDGFLVSRLIARKDISGVDIEGDSGGKREVPLCVEYLSGDAEISIMFRFAKS